MNLLIEQRPTTITSQVEQQLSNQDDVNNSSSSLILKIKRQTIKQQTDFNSTSLSMANEDNINSRITLNNQHSKRSILNPTICQSSSPTFNDEEQAKIRSITIDKNNNDLNSNINNISSKKRFKQDNLTESSKTKVDASVETVSIGLATEPDQLGPCEPGTSVVLEGIVWNETDSGILVVNVTWRGKTYVGTLLDSTKQDWACPRLICESPTSDYDPRNSSKNSRSKRSSTVGNNRCLTYSSTSSVSSLSSNILSTASDDRKLRHHIKTRQSKRTNLNTIDEIATNYLSPLTSPFRTNTTFFSSSNHDLQLILCPESQCCKQFVSITALNYHLSNAHKKTDSSLSISTQQANTQDEEDVAHILVNVADYVRRPSSDHQRQTTLTWPHPQMSSKFAQSSSLNNNDKVSKLLSTNSISYISNNGEINVKQDESKSTVKRSDHFVLNRQDESKGTLLNFENDPTNNNGSNKTLKIPTPPPSSFVPINLTSTMDPPLTSSSPTYSDISDEDITMVTNANEQNSLSTINLLTMPNGKFNHNEQSFISKSSWATQMLLQQYGSYIQQQAFINKELTSNCLNSKTNSNGANDSTVKNILDSRPIASSSTAMTTTLDSNVLLNDHQKTCYHYHANGVNHDSKLSTSLIDSLTLSNENVLNSSMTNPYDYSLHNMSSSSIQPSR